MSETKAEYQARMGRKFDRLSAETTRLINENQRLRVELANASGRCEGVPQHVHDMIDLQETIDALRAENAALKGDHIPYAYLVEVETRGGFCSKTECYVDYPGAVPVFTHPQKPVVLPDHKLFTRSAVVAAIEAAGGTVADV